MKLIYFILLFGFTSVLLSCSRNQDEDLAQNPSMVQIFDLFYKSMDEQYVFWDIDATDWRQMYQYRPQFEILNINNQQDQLQAVSLLREMTKDLLDHHFTIDFTAEGIRGLQINPARARKSLEAIPSDFDSIKEVESWIDGDIHYGEYNNDSQFLTGLIGDNTLVFKTNYFNFRKNYNAEANTEADQTLNWFFDTVEGATISEVILDLRSCAGGDLVDLNFFLGKLLVNDINFGYTKFKLGRAQTHYTPLMPAVIKSRRINKSLAPKITVLTNGMTASLAELMAYIIQSNQLGDIVGTRTYGATSPISDVALFNSGSINIGNFMRIRTASVQFLDRNSRSIEGIGVIPD